MPTKCPIFLLDGGLGTSLEAPPYNTKFSESTPLWSSHLLLSSPNTLVEAQKDFVRNGADILLTATYQASFEGFAATPRLSPSAVDLRKENGTVPDVAQEVSQVGHGKDKAERIMRSAIPITQSAFSENDKGKIIALSLGAYGATMRPSQEYTGIYPSTLMDDPSGLSNWHAERLAVFAESQETWDAVDFVAFETIPLLKEIHSIRIAMANGTRGERRKKWWISCVFPNEAVETGYMLPDGSPPAEVIKAMLSRSRDDNHQRPWGVGINCTKVEKIGPLIQSYEEGIQDLIARGDLTNHDWPWLILCPDGAEGLVYNTSTQTWDETAGYDKVRQEESWDQKVFQMVMKIREGNKWKGIIVGGCCKTSAAHIGRLKGRFDEIGLDWSSSRSEMLN